MDSPGVLQARRLGEGRCRCTEVLTVALQVAIGREPPVCFGVNHGEKRTFIDRHDGRLLTTRKQPRERPLRGSEACCDGTVQSPPGEGSLAEESG